MILETQITAKQMELNFTEYIFHGIVGVIIAVCLLAIVIGFIIYYKRSESFSKISPRGRKLLAKYKLRPVQVVEQISWRVVDEH